MVGKNWKKILAVGICGLMAAGVIAGCGNNSGSSGNSGKMKVGVVQIVQHPALDESNKGFVDALNESGLKDKIEIDQQNAQEISRTSDLLLTDSYLATISLLRPFQRLQHRLWPMQQIKFRSFAPQLQILKMQN